MIHVGVENEAIIWACERLNRLGSRGSMPPSIPLCHAVLEGLGGRSLNCCPTAAVYAIPFSVSFFWLRRAWQVVSRLVLL